MNVLVTGANGFVGSFLCKILTGDGHKVIEVTLETHGDICGDFDWTEILNGVDAVVHLAARVHQMSEKSKDPLSDYRRVNTAATLNLARTAQKKGVKHFVFLSSIKVNGEGDSNPYSHESTPHPLDPYSISKFEAEVGLKEISKSGEMIINCIRPPLIYGKGVKANFKKLIYYVEKLYPLPIKGIENKRSFIYVENLVDFIVNTFNLKMKKFNIFLISDGNDLSTFELHKKISDTLQIKNRCFYFPQSLLKILLIILGLKRVYNRLAGNLMIDSSLAQSFWNPPFTIDEGLKKTLEKE